MALLSTPTSAKAWAMDVQAFAAEDAIPDALINEITTVGAYIEGDDVAVRVPVVDDDEADIVNEGAEIPEAEPTLNERTLLTVKVAKLLRVSYEQFEQERAPELLSNAAARSIITKADAVLLNQPTPTAPDVRPPGGLLAQGLDDAGTVAANLDALVDALADLRANGSKPSHFVLSPSAWASLSKFKTATGSAMNLLGAGTEATVPMLLSVPVVVNNQVPTGTGLIVDRSDIVSVIGPVNIAVSDTAYFAFDGIGIRITFRFGATLVHPERHAKFSVNAPA